MAEWSITDCLLPLTTDRVRIRIGHVRKLLVSDLGVRHTV